MGIASGPAHHQKIENGYQGDPDNDYWFRDERHGQFDRAAKSVPAPQEGRRVRIAHLDTGYDRNHATCPPHIRGDLQKNFVEADRPDDATDRHSGLINNFSHGCGTLSILAGAGRDGVRAFGCAPDAEIVPIRVAHGVVLFSNSSIARGLDYVHKLCANEATRIHVVSMSMGGLPSQAWADAINQLYEAGVTVVCAAGNNYANAPTRFIVYPARFNRVIAACGVMAQGDPYANLPPLAMAGNYGPDSKMRTAIAAYTPNVPWARFGEETVVDFDGNGTSAATPQVAAIAALWIQKFRQAYDAYPETWMRVEAVRAALFESAAAPEKNLAEKIGQGRLQAAQALEHAPKPVPALKPENSDNADWALLKLLLGDAAPLAAASRSHLDMLEIEAMQALISNGFEFELDETARMRRAETIDKLLRLRTISEPLRKALSAGRSAPVISEHDASSTQEAAPVKSRADEELEAVHLQSALHPPYPLPPHRELRIYAYDPGQRTKPDLFDVAEATVAVRWESLEPGPVGEYLEIIDVDPASEQCYAPVNLEDPRLLAQNGLAPPEPSPQFHQQMIYAVVGCIATGSATAFLCA
jgi:Subtilase family